MPELSYFRRLRHWLTRYPRLECLMLPVRPLSHGARNLRTHVNRWLAHLCNLPLLCKLIWYSRWLNRQGRHRIPHIAPVTESPKIVMLACSWLAADPRIEREARTLAAAGFRVKVLCPAWSPVSAGPLLLPDWGPQVTFDVLPYEAVHYKDSCPWIFSPDLLRVALQEEGVWAYHAHDLDTALPALVAAAKKGVPCVCDFHEWYSENVSYDVHQGLWTPHSWLKRWLSRMMERVAVSSASRIITVCESIARELEQQYAASRPIFVVRNIPPLDRDAILPPTIDIRANLRIPSGKALLLYQGGVGPSRGLETLIEAMGMVQHAVLVIRGPGIDSFKNSYLRLAERSGASDRVFCLAPVPSRHCVSEAKAADLGFWTLMPICKNFTYALPNKVFEYLAAGVPVVCAHHAEVLKVVHGFDVGRCFDPEDPRSIAKVIDQMASDVALRRRCQANIPRALAELQADREWTKLVALYEQLGDVKLPNSPKPWQEAA
jgi:glycosyltransferase involved in cell wall biosynthesis